MYGYTMSGREWEGVRSQDDSAKYSKVRGDVDMGRENSSCRFSLARASGPGGTVGRSVCSGSMQTCTRRAKGRLISDIHTGSHLSVSLRCEYCSTPLPSTPATQDARGTTARSAP